MIDLDLREGICLDGVVLVRTWGDWSAWGVMEVGHGELCEGGRVGHGYGVHGCCSWEVGGGREEKEAASNDMWAINHGLFLEV